MNKYKKGVSYFFMRRMSDLYLSFLRGKKFKEMSDIDLNRLPIKTPADLVGNSAIMQELAKKHSKSFKKKNPR
jgi:hypothetical protein